MVPGCEEHPPMDGTCFDYAARDIVIAQLLYYSLEFVLN